MPASGSPGCGIPNGYGPGPDVTTVCPICELAGHVPCAACGSPHTGTFEINPANPAGILNDSFSMRCCPSPRESNIVNPENAPALSVVAPAESSGLNGNVAAGQPD